MQIILILLFSILPKQDFQWVSFEMTKRTTANGSMTVADATVCYNSTGEIVTYFQRPLEMYILNNTLGEYQIYNPSLNTVVRSVDNRLSSQNTTFIYFLLGQSSDMGLESSGFILRDSKVEDNLLVSEYTAPTEIRDRLDYVELVSNGRSPVFMGYIDRKGNYTRKTYYYDYEIIGNFDLPKSITEIDFVNGDSIVSKTTFVNFKFDDSSDLELVNYKVPDNAKLIK